MLDKSRRYVWQIVSANDGTRSDPVVCGPLEFKSALVDMTEEEMDSSYVLLLADTTEGIAPQEFVSRFPLYRVSTFVNLDVCVLTSPVGGNHE